MEFTLLLLVDGTRCLVTTNDTNNFLVNFQLGCHWLVPTGSSALVFFPPIPLYLHQASLTSWSEGLADSDHWGKPVKTHEAAFTWLYYFFHVTIYILGEIYIAIACVQYVNKILRSFIKMNRQVM